MPDLTPAIKKVWTGAPGANPLLKTGLGALAKIYSALMRMRASYYRYRYRRVRRLPCKVISVGNLTTGGTGKTPMTRYLARYLGELGLRVVVVSRGYGGTMESQGGIVSDGRRILADARQAGDEPYLLARTLPDIPVVVGADRHAAGLRAMQAFRPDVIVLDDAFQHLKLWRDINLVLLDAAKPFGNGCLLPAGELREPIRALQRADAVVLTRSDTDDALRQLPQTLRTIRGITPVPVFTTRHITVIHRIIPADPRPAPAVDPAGPDEAFLAGQRVFAFSGVAKNDYFLYTLAGLKCLVAGSQQFADHYRYTRQDLQSVCRQARELKVAYVVTTAKDLVKMDPDIDWPVSLVALDVTVACSSKSERFQSFIEQGLGLRE